MLLALALVACGGGGGGGDSGGGGGGGGGGSTGPTADAWSPVSANPEYAAVAYGAGNYVLVGSNGAVLTSNDMNADWHFKYLFADDNSQMTFTGVAFGGGKFVAVTTTYGLGGSIATSTDGLTWTTTGPNQRTGMGDCSAAGFAGILHDGSQFLAAQDQSPYSVCGSTDGLTWNTVSGPYSVAAIAYDTTLGYLFSLREGSDDLLQGATPLVAGSNPLDLNGGGNAIPFAAMAAGQVGGNPLIVAVGDNALRDGTNTRSVLTYNGTATLQAGGPAVNLRGVAIGAGLIVAVGENGAIYTSTDGAAWTDRTSALGTSQHLNVAFYDGTGFVTAGNYGEAAVGNAAGTTWNERSAGQGPPAINSVGFNGSNLFLASAYTPRTFVCQVWTSADATTWSQKTGLSVCPSGKVAWHAGLSRWAVGGGQGIGLSTDTIGTDFSWKAANPAGYRAVRGLNGQLFALGESHDNTGSPLDVLVSGDPTVSLTLRTPANLAGMNDIAYGSSTYVAVGNSGAISTSTDGVSWTANATTNTTANLYAVAYDGASTWVAVGAAGNVVYATDPTGTWTRNDTGFAAQDARDVIYDGGQFVLVGTTNLVMTSPDGSTAWANATPDATRITVSSTFNAIATPGAGLYVAVGTSGGRYLFNAGGSTDLAGNRLSWTNYAGAGQTYADVVYDGSNSRFVAVGSQVATSANGTTWSTIALSTDMGGAVPGSVTTLGTTTYAVTNTVQTYGYLMQVPTSGTATPLYGGTSEHLRVITDTLAQTYFLNYGPNAHHLGRSADGATWTLYRVPYTTNGGFGDVVYGAGNYFGSRWGDGAIFRVPNAMGTWTQLTGGTVGSNANLAFGGGRLAAVSIAGHMAAYSSDLATLVVGTASYDLDNVVNGYDVGMVYDGTQFVAVNGHHALRSADGSAWTVFTTTVPGQGTVLSTGSGFVLTGPDGLVATHGSTFP